MRCRWGCLQGRYPLVGIFPRAEAVRNPHLCRHPPRQNVFLLVWEHSRKSHLSLLWHRTPLSVLAVCSPQYFPGRPLVQNFLYSVDDWLKRQQKKKIPYSYFKTALDSRREVSLGAEDFLPYLDFCGKRG